MGNAFGINLILLTILLSPDSLSWGNQVENEGIRTRFSNEATYSLWISTRENESSFSLLGTPAGRKNFYDAGLINPFRSKEIPADLEIDS